MLVALHDAHANVVNIEITREDAKLFLHVQLDDESLVFDFGQLALQVHLLVEIVTFKLFLQVFLESSHLVDLHCTASNCVI